MAMVPIERAFNQAEAQSEITRVICSLGLTYELSIAGELVFAAKCCLRDRSGRLVASGLGKGEEQSAVVGAMFEAVEHYVTDFRFLRSSDILYVPSSHFSSKGEGVLANLISSVIYQSHPGNLPCISHSPLSAERENVICPIGLFIPSYVEGICGDRSLNLDDTYVYSRLGDYCSSAGIAIGMNKTEAVIHGLLESSERDALSKFIFDVFLKCEVGALQRLHMTSLPHHLRILADKVAKECSVENVSIYVLPNRLGIPTYCSWINNSIMGVYQAGFGCSLSESHAIERSLNEVAQRYLSYTKLYEASVVDELHRKKIRNLQDHPSLLNCAKFDIADMEKLYGYKLVRYQGIEHDLHYGLKHYLHRILSRMRCRNARAYSFEFAFPVESSIKVTHNLISDSDRFMTVLGGRAPMPSTVQHGGSEGDIYFR